MAHEPRPQTVTTVHTPDPAPPVTDLVVRVVGRSRWTAIQSALGEGSLADSRIILASPALASALAAGAAPVAAEITWRSDGRRHAERIAVVGHGPRRSPRPGPSLNPRPTTGPGRGRGREPWALELATPSAAFRSAIPEGAHPANAWCFMFPWLSFCQQRP